MTNGSLGIRALAFVILSSWNLRHSSYPPFGPCRLDHFARLTYCKLPIYLMYRASRERQSTTHDLGSDFVVLLETLTGATWFLTRAGRSVGRRISRLLAGRNERRSGAHPSAGLGTLTGGPRIWKPSGGIAHRHLCSRLDARLVRAVRQRGSDPGAVEHQAIRQRIRNGPAIRAAVLTVGVNRIECVDPIARAIGIKQFRLIARGGELVVTRTVV